MLTANAKDLGSCFRGDLGPANGLGFSGVAQHQDIPGKTNKRQAEPGAFRVPGQGEVFIRATSVCKRVLDSFSGSGRVVRFLSQAWREGGLRV